VYTAFIIRALIVLMMEAVGMSETSVNFYEATRHSIPEGCHLHTFRHENLKSHKAAIKANKTNSKYVQHILETGHSYFPLEHFVEILHKTGNGSYLNTLKEFHIIS
jgi:hypothetical protein